MPISKLNGSHPEGAAIQRAVSRQTGVRELRAIQEVVINRINDPQVDNKSLCNLAQTYVALREGIRIEKGWVKPGSRNISVRELSAQERIDKLPVSRSTKSYLTAAREVAAEHAKARPTEDSPAKTEGN